MKKTKVLRFFGILVILTLLSALIPAMPAMAVESLAVDPEEGAIDDTVTVIGTGYSPSETQDKYVDIYFTLNGNSRSYTIDSQIDTYETLRQGVWIDQNGEFEVSVKIPENLNDGDDVEQTQSGTTYYISATAPYTNGLNPAKLIYAWAEFTVIGGDIEIDPEEGPVDTEIQIFGSGFSSREDVIIEFDRDEVDIEDGDDQTDSSGEFESYILVPESTAGDKTITVTVGSSEVEATFSVEADIVLDKQSGESGTQVTVSGTGFDRRETVDLWFNDTTQVGSVTSGSSGSFSGTFTVPDGLSAGSYVLEADDGSNTARANFTVNVPPPPTPAPEPTPEPTPPPTPPPSVTSTSISQETGSVGTDVVLGGAGFKAASPITVKYDDKAVATVNSDANGIFVATFKVPTSKAGDHTINVSDGTNSEDITFTVESEPLDVPKPLKPEMGIKVKAPVLFDWEEVTSSSTPVTYTLQIAKASDFSENSIVLEKKGIEDSEYTLSEAEVLDLEAQTTPFYWRVRAVDAASNTSEWTGAGEFTITPPFSFPSWALYTLLGIGAVIIFAIGYFLGRRTAYYY